MQNKTDLLNKILMKELQLGRYIENCKNGTWEKFAG